MIRIYLWLYSTSLYKNNCQLKLLRPSVYKINAVYGSIPMMLSIPTKYTTPDSHLNPMISSSRLNLSAALFREDICCSCLSIILLISFISLFRSTTAFSRFGPLASGAKGPGFDSTSLEQTNKWEEIFQNKIIIFNIFTIFPTKGVSTQISCLHYVDNQLHCRWSATSFHFCFTVLQPVMVGVVVVD